MRNVRRGSLVLPVKSMNSVAKRLVIPRACMCWSTVIKWRIHVCVIPVAFMRVCASFLSSTSIHACVRHSWSIPACVCVCVCVCSCAIPLWCAVWLVCIIPIAFMRVCASFLAVNLNVDAASPMGDNVHYYICKRLKLEGETENMGVCTKARKGVTAVVLMATPCTNS